MGSQTTLRPRASTNPSNQGTPQPRPPRPGPSRTRTGRHVAGPRPARTTHREGGSARLAGGRANAESPLGRGPPGAGVVTSGGVRVVGDTGTVVLVGGGDEGVVTFGARVVFPAAVITQSAARQPTAKSSGRESPDIASSALALERKLGHRRLRPSLRPLQRSLRDSAPPAGARRRHKRAACEGGAPAIPSGTLWEGAMEEPRGNRGKVFSQQTVLANRRNWQDTGNSSLYPQVATQGAAGLLSFLQ